MRCESRGELYPISTITNTANPPSTFAVLSHSLWHDRLGHPGATIIDSLRLNNFIKCNPSRTLNVCHACSLGKHAKLPFVASNSRTFMPFDVIHCDLWTSPVLSSSGHRYYMLLLDDYSNFCGLFFCLKNLNFLRHSLLFEHLSALNLSGTSRPYNVIMVENLIIRHFGNCVKIMVCVFVSRVLTPLHKMGRPSEKFELLITLSGHYSLMHQSLRLFGITLYKRPLIS